MIRPLLFVVTILGLTAGHVDAVQVDASQCWNRCVTCESRCSRKSGQDRNDCASNCEDASATCCEAHGQRGTFHGCGCTS